VDWATAAAGSDSAAARYTGPSAKIRLNVIVVSWFV